MIRQAQTQEELENLYVGMFNMLDRKQAQQRLAQQELDGKAHWEEPNQIDVDYVEVMEIETEYPDEN